MLSKSWRNIDVECHMICVLFVECLCAM
jgi:hypothetical protein